MAKWQNGARMANGTHSAPPPRNFFTQAFMTCASCAWLGLEMELARGQKS